MQDFLKAMIEIIFGAALFGIGLVSVLIECGARAITNLFAGK
jgi:hypothetical protein